MPIKLVMHPPIDDARLSQVRAAAQNATVVNAATLDEALANMPDADAFFGKLTPPLLAAATRLKWVQSPTASLEHYVFDALVEHPCTLTNMRGLFSDVIADQVLGYIICAARNLHLYMRRQLERRWAPVGGEMSRVSYAVGPGVVSSIDIAHRHLSDLTVGIVGLGAIGREIARRAAAFGMPIVAVDLQTDDKPVEVRELWPIAELPRLLATSDFVVIAAPHTPETAQMFRAAQYAQMRQSAWLINIGRGAIVNLDDLVAALQSGTIAGAALDVYETEPLPAEHPLWGFENVILTPHVAGYSPRIAERHLGVLLENVRRFTSGEPLMNVVDKRAWF
ncbi:MAG: D-2-hydroxyacid dehydrogenase [Planctomycetaceae bacterium]|nr:D-2-hydroxyacid dehydrogenase [Planctomycetaceae bacterium]